MNKYITQSNAVFRLYILYIYILLFTEHNRDVSPETKKKKHCKQHIEFVELFSLWAVALPL